VPVISALLRGCAALVLIADGLQAGGVARTEAKPGNGSAVIPIDVLRHPISTKVRKMLLSAMAKIDLGQHEPAIAELQEMLRKYPDSAPYVHDLLGAEYVRTDRYEAAVSSFEQAVSLLPHDAMTHYNFGLALVCAGDYARATQEVRRALELDPENSTMRERLNALLERTRAPAPAR
jgi:Flp pilus assembly protein TadD